jgi:LPXTG-motif cell wall-anchored protein
MTPARSLAASVVALGFASTLTAPLPAIAAPAPCERAENYAAQSGAELLRIDRLDMHSISGERPVSRSGADKPDGRSGDGPQGRPGADASAVQGADDRLLDHASGSSDRDAADADEDGDLVSQGAGMMGGASSGSETGGGGSASSGSGAGSEARSSSDGQSGSGAGSGSGADSGSRGGSGSGADSGSPGRSGSAADSGSRGRSGSDAGLGSEAGSRFSAIDLDQKAETGGTGAGGTVQGGAASTGGMNSARISRVATIESAAGTKDAGVVRNTAAVRDADDGSFVADSEATGGTGAGEVLAGDVARETGNGDVSHGLNADRDDVYVAIAGRRAGEIGADRHESDNDTDGGARPSSTSGENATAAGAGRGGKDAVLTGVGLGDAKTALVANAQVNSAAVARMLDGQAAGKSSLAEPVIQQAPPSNDKASTRGTPADRVGPMELGTGQVTAHAAWDPGMACGNATGKAGRSAASLNRLDILKGENGALVGVPEKISSLSTTALERRGPAAQTIASATISAGRITLAGGRIRVRVLRAPTLTATMSIRAGGEIRYLPAAIEVSGKDIKTARLDTVGDDVEFSLRDDSRGTEAGSPGALAQLGGVRTASPLPLPAIPGLPSVQSPAPESATTAGSGTKVRISLGDVRQASRDHAIAAKAATIRVTITRGAVPDRRIKPGYGVQPRATTSLNMVFGVLEAAAVAPETEAPQVSAAGAGGGLPVTGSNVTMLAMAGVALVLAGGAALFFGMRRRRSHP